MRSGAKSASLQTDVFAQNYALVVVHAAVGLDLPSLLLADVSHNRHLPVVMPTIIDNWAWCKLTQTALSIICVELFTQ